MTAPLADPTPAPPAPPPTPTPAPTPAPAGPAPAPAPPAPAPPAPAPVPTAPTQQQPRTGPQNGPDGYPLNTPLVEMDQEQQTAYWRGMARKHEDRVKAMADYDQLKETHQKYEQLVAASQTEHEKAVAEARRQGHAEATTQAGSRLVEAYVLAAAAGRLDQERVNALLDGMDRTKFLSTTGEVDTAKVTAFVHALAPAAPAPAAAQQAPETPPPAALAPPSLVPPRGPDFGQGQPSTARATGLEAGREIARLRFAQQQKTA